MPAKIITCGNMKGGVGKSSLTSIFATYIHNILKESVLVIDADDMQQTISTIRKDEISKGSPKEHLFPVIESNSINASEWVEKFIEEYDYIFIDLPGNLKQQGVINAYLMADLIIVPTSLSKEDIDASMIFLNIIMKDIIPARKEIGLDTEVIAMLYKVRKMGKDYKEFLQHKEQFPIRFFDEVVPISDVLSKQTSTFENVQYKTKTFEMSSILDEFRTLIKK